MNAPTFNVITAIKGGLLVISAALSLLLVVELSRVHVPARQIMVTKNTDPANSTVKRDWAIEEMNVYAEIMQRPLFHEDRKPFVYVPVPAPAPVVNPVPPVAILPPPQLQLMATIITPEIRVAILKSQASNKTQRLKVGEVIEGWSVAEIQKEEIIIQQGTITHAIELKVIGGNTALQSASP